MGIDRRMFVMGICAAALPLRQGSAHLPAPIAVGDFSVAFAGLDKPEGIAIARDGRLFLSNMQSAIAIVAPGGSVRHVGKPVAPTGVALDGRERIIIANMGLLNGRPGTLDRLDPATGKVETLVLELEGRALVASNAPTVARNGTIYCTHSTWGPVGNIGTTDPGGFVYMVRPNGTAQIVARGLRGANGCCLDRSERYLYVSLTAEGRICRFRRRADGTLGARENFGGVLGAIVPNHMAADIRKMSPAARAALGYPDNIAFDTADNLWICLPFANRIVALTPGGRKVDIAHDPEGRFLVTPTSLAWGGADLKDLHIVSRGSGTIVKARTSVAGLPLANRPR